MANAILYYRTYATRTSVTADPQGLPTLQKLEFTFPDDIMEGINENYSNNIKQLPIPNQEVCSEAEVVQEKEPFEDYVQEQDSKAEESIQKKKDPMFEEVEVELRKEKEKASRDIDSKFSKARKDLNLKKEEET